MPSDRSGEVVQQVGQQLTSLGSHMVKRVDDLKTELQNSQQEFQTKLSSHVSEQIAEGITLEKRLLKIYEEQERLSGVISGRNDVAIYLLGSEMI